MRQTVPWNQWSFCLWRYHFRTQQIQQLSKCMVSQSSAWQGRAFVQSVINKDFSYILQPTQPSYSWLPYLHSYWAQPATKSNVQHKMWSLQPRSQSTWGMLRWEKQVLEGQGKPQQQLGEQQSPRGRWNGEEKSPKLHHKISALSRTAKVVSQSWCWAKGSCDRQELEKGVQEKTQNIYPQE